MSDGYGLFKDVPRDQLRRLRDDHRHVAGELDHAAPSECIRTTADNDAWPKALP